MSRFSMCSRLMFTLILAVGCGDGKPPAFKSNATPNSGASTARAKDDHGHKHDEHASHGAGPHEGVLADWGGGKFHVEFCVDRDKQTATVYVLGNDEKTATPIKATNILLTISDPTFQVELTAAPMEGEPDGTASRFVGKHENLGKVQEFAGTISGEIDGTPYAGDFKAPPHDAHDTK
jgi:hypothetical protein